MCMCIITIAVTVYGCVYYIVLWSVYVYAPVSVLLLVSGQVWMLLVENALM